MEKKCNSSSLMQIRLRKTLLTMKFLCFFFLVVRFCLGCKLFTECKFTISLNDVALTEVFSTIRQIVNSRLSTIWMT